MAHDSIEEQATGCIGANSYKDYARDQGYTRVEVLNWCSSAGDWQFIVSKDGTEWRILDQTNNYPRQGFSHSISDEVFYGTPEEVYAEIEARYG
mgnify:FL=1